MKGSKRELYRPQLCLVTDPTVPDLIHKVELAIDAGITMLQIRGPQLSTHRLYNLAQALGPRCQRYGVTFIVNDRIDVGLVIQADGFQLGRRSLPVARARDLVGPQYLLGVSVHTASEASTALAQGADFLLAGTIFASRSHPGEQACGLQLLQILKEAHPDVPMLAIGGITSENASEVMAAGADGIAVISAILNTQQVTRAVKALRYAIGL